MMPSAAADAATTNAEPFLLRAGRTGCLLIHGFTGTPQEMRFLGTRLHSVGHSVHGIQLAGHGTSVDDLERSRWPDWYASACRGVARLQGHTPQLVAVGQSMGALLALKLAVDYPETVTGAVLLSPALRLANPGLPWIRPLLPLLGRNRYIDKAHRDVADPQARAESPSSPRIPLLALHQLLLLQKHTRQLLPQVRQPVLVIHSRQDHTCPLRNVALLQRGLRGPVRTVLLDASFHVISIDVDKERVAAEVAAFVDGVSENPSPRQ